VVATGLQSSTNAGYSAHWLHLPADQREDLPEPDVPAQEPSQRGRSCGKSEGANMSEGFNATQREAEIHELGRRLYQAEWVLQSSGFRRCDIPACNCNSWHQVGGYAERFREIREAVEEAGYSTNGKVLLDVVKEIIAAAQSPAIREGNDA
jgi:hypothetical protein